MKTHSAAFSEAYAAIMGGAHVIVSDAFMDWMDENYPEHNVKTALNRRPIGTLDRLVAFIGAIPFDAEYTKNGHITLNGVYLSATRGETILFKPRTGETFIMADRPERWMGK